jgi:hypothetical protein
VTEHPHLRLIDCRQRADDDDNDNDDIGRLPAGWAIIAITATSVAAWGVILMLVR